MRRALFEARPRAPARLAPLLLALSLAAASHADSAHEREELDHETARRLREAGQILSLEELVSRARSAHPGRLLEAELEEKRGRYVYEVEILDEGGRVWRLYYDAASGEALNVDFDED